MDPSEYSFNLNEALFQPFMYEGELVLEVECGANIAWMFLSRLCQGSKGASILFQNIWVTPNEFQFISGRETAKDWKRSIRHKGRSLKLLMAKGYFDFHSSTCVCKGLLAKNNSAGPSGQWMQGGSEDGDEGVVTPLESLARFCSEELRALSESPASPEQDFDYKMDVEQKANNETKQGNIEPKKGKQLTSIIDQLRINKSKEEAQPEERGVEKQKSRKRSFSPWQQDSDTNDASGRLSAHSRGHQMPTDAAPKPATPDAETESSPSVSPHSPSPGRGFLSLPFGGLPLRAAPFSPPLERFSPANPAIKQMELMTRNYSDFMRCLAAKYNQNNNQDSFPMTQSNGLVRGYDASSFSYKGNSPFLPRNSDSDGSSGGLSGGLNRKADSQNSPTSTEPRNNNNNNNANCSPVLTGGVGTCGISDFSSSQTLLNLVRTASAQSASQLETYLKGAVKRSADGEVRLDPLDLTVGAVSKKPKLDLSGVRDCRDLFNNSDPESILGGGDSPGNARTGTGSKPSWMSLLDKRMHSSPTSSSRSSPKIQNTERSRCVSLCVEKSCSSQSEASDLAHWTVDDVVKFVSGVDTCGEYVEKFREESIDGTTLPLLTEDHLTMHLGMKLGPALKLRSTLARRIGHCAVCMHCVHCHGDESPDARRHEASRSPTVSK